MTTMERFHCHVVSPRRAPATLKCCRIMKSTGMYVDKPFFLVAFKCQFIDLLFSRLFFIQQGCLDKYREAGINFLHILFLVVFAISFFEVRPLLLCYRIRFKMTRFKWTQSPCSKSTSNSRWSCSKQRSAPEAFPSFNEDLKEIDGRFHWIVNVIFFYAITKIYQEIYYQKMSLDIDTLHGYIAFSN